MFSARVVSAYSAFALCLMCLPLAVVRAQEDDVVPGVCAESTLEGYDFQVEPASGYSLHWNLSPDLETVSFQAVINADLPGWLSVGFSSDGDMIGSDAVVGFPTQGTIVEYDLDSKVTAFIQPSPNQELTSTAVEKAGGVTSLTFTRPATPVGVGKMPLLTGSNASVTLIWAFGPVETFGYHFDEGRGSISVDLFCSGGGGLDDVGETAPPTASTGFPVTTAPSPSPDGPFSASPTVAPASTEPPRSSDDNTNGASTLVRARVTGLGGVWGGVGASAVVVGLLTTGLAAAMLL